MEEREVTKIEIGIALIESVGEKMFYVREVGKPENLFRHYNISEVYCYAMSISGSDSELFFTEVGLKFAFDMVSAIDWHAKNFREC